MRIFDYLYYRTFCWYKKKNDSNPKTMGELVVSVFIATILFSLLTILTFSLFPMPRIDKWQTLIFIIFVYSIVKYRYTKIIDQDKLDEIWKNECYLVKQQRGWVIIISIFIFLTFPIFIGYLRHNLGVNI